MRHRFFRVILLVIACTFLSRAGVLAQGPTDSQKIDKYAAKDKVAGRLLASPAAEAIPDRYIIIFKPDTFNGGQTATGETPRQLAQRLVGENNGQLHFVYEKGLSGFAATLTPLALQRVLALPEIDYIEADQVTPLLPPQPELDLSLQEVQANPTWGLDRIDQRDLPLDDAYAYGTNGTNVHAYILDTGIRASHTEFSGRVGAGYDFVDLDANPDDCHGHGTHVAGTIGGTTYGVAKNVTVHAVRVLNCSGSGTYSGIIAGINWVKDYGQRPALINMSLGGGYSQSLNDAVAAAHAAGVTVVVAAGNESTDACSKSPASAPAAITVGATTSTDARASFSNYGTCVDLFAPGYGITAAWIGSDTALNTISGTSMASPHVAGVTALYLGANPTATPDQVVTDLGSMATPDKVSSPGSGSPNLLLYMAAITPQAMQVSPYQQSVCGGLDADYTVTLAEETAVPVTLSVQGQPAGSQAGFTPNPISSSGGSATLTISQTGQALPGSYDLVVSGATISTTLVTTVGLTLLDSPPAVSPSLPGQNATGVSLIPTFSWGNQAAATSYDLELGTDPGFASPVYTATATTNQHTLQDRLEANTTYHWRVRAANSCGASAYAAATFTTGAAPTILLVDDDDNDPDVRSHYTAALDGLNQRYDIYDTRLNNDLDPGAALLANYQTVIWFTGYSYDAATGPDPTGETELATYLAPDNKSCLFLNSQDYLWAQTPDDTPTAFMSTYLGVGGAISDMADASATGVNAFAGLGPYTLNDYYMNYADWLIPDNSGANAFVGDVGVPVAVSKTAPTYATTWWSFPFEFIPTADARQTAMARVLSWCAQATNKAPTNLSLSGNQVPENQPAGTVVGSLSTTDPDSSGPFTYSLVAGSGATDNSRFTIAGATLKTAASFDFEAQASYAIRVQTKDGLDGVLAKAFTITIQNVDEAPLARPDTSVTLVDTPDIIEVLKNDSDPEGVPLTLLNFSQPAHGSLLDNGDGSLIYTPQTGYKGQDSFTYTTGDGQLTASAGVTVTITQGNAHTTTAPDQTAELSFNGDNNPAKQTRVQIPAGAVTETVEMVYSELAAPSATTPPDVQGTSRSFFIEVFIGGQPQQSFTFSQPISITLTYDPAALNGLSPTLLELRYWHEASQSWQTDGITLLSHDAANHQLIYQLEHLTEFALFVRTNSVPDNQVYLPLVIK